MSGLSLYAIETDLAALIESQDLVTPEQEQEYANDLIVALKTAVEKRDAVAQYIAHLLNQADLAAGEVLRLKKRETRFRTAAAKLGAYVLNVIQEIGVDAKGKWKRLEGQTVTFVPKKCPPSVEIDDLSQIPAEYLRVHLDMSMKDWLDVAAAVGGQRDLAARLNSSVKSEPSKTSIRAAFDRGEKVRGARLIDDKLRLEIT